MSGGFDCTLTLLNQQKEQSFHTALNPGLSLHLGMEHCTLVISNQGQQHYCENVKRWLRSLAWKGDHFILTFIACKGHVIYVNRLHVTFVQSVTLTVQIWV